MRSDKLHSQLERKSKICFLLLSLIFIFPELNKKKFWSHSLHFQNWGILLTRMDERRPHENEFWQFSDAEINITDSYSSKSRWKNGAICLSPFFLSKIMVLKLPKIVHFLQICADYSKKPKYIKAIYFYPRPHQALS